MGAATPSKKGLVTKIERTFPSHELHDTFSGYVMLLAPSFLHSPPYMRHSFIILFLNNDLIPQYGCEADVVQ
jgi:hypothetical protein